MEGTYMNALKPRTGEFIASTVAGIGFFLLAISLLFYVPLDLVMGLLLVISVIMVMASVRDGRNYFCQRNHYRSHRQMIDEHVLLRQQIYNRLWSIKIACGMTKNDTFDDDNGLEFIASREGFDCVLTLSQDSRYDEETSALDDIELVRSYFIPRGKNVAIQTQSDALVTTIHSDQSIMQSWFSGAKDCNWMTSPENQASNEELKELLEHIDTISLA